MHIGTDSIIMPGVVIGDNVIIGCGTIVTKNIPSNSVVVGVPGRVIESIDEYRIKHEKDFVNTRKMKPNEKKDFLESHYKSK